MYFGICLREGKDRKEITKQNIAASPKCFNPKYFFFTGNQVQVKVVVFYMICLQRKNSSWFYLRSNVLLYILLFILYLTFQNLYDSSINNNPRLDVLSLIVILCGLFHDYDLSWAESALPCHRHFTIVSLDHFPDAHFSPRVIVGLQSEVGEHAAALFHQYLLVIRGSSLSSLSDLSHCFHAKAVPSSRTWLPSSLV